MANIWKLWFHTLQCYYDSQMYMQMPYSMCPPGYAAVTTGPFFPQPFGMPIPVPMPHLLQPAPVPPPAPLAVDDGEPLSQMPANDVCDSVDDVRSTATPFLPLDTLDGSYIVESPPPESINPPSDGHMPTTGDESTAPVMNGSSNTIYDYNGQPQQQQPMYHPMASYYMGLPAPMGTPIAMAPQVSL